MTSTCDRGQCRPRIKPLALDWFIPKKRALLAPFGVGTIDQVELAALNVPHVALRLAGLAGKVVILDEVHAYDTYMTTIIERLLQWLAAMGASVIILSATLPMSRRGRPGARLSAPTLRAAETDAYPSLWVVGPRAGQPCGVAGRLPASAERSATPPAETWPTTNPRPRPRWLLEAVRGGGCACWITNTVRRAQDIFRALQAARPAGRGLTCCTRSSRWRTARRLRSASAGIRSPPGARPPARHRHRHPGVGAEPGPGF